MNLKKKIRWKNNKKMILTPKYRYRLFEEFDGELVGSNTYFRYMGINITSYLSKYEDIRAPVKERKKKREIDILSPAIRKLQFMDN